MIVNNPGLAWGWNVGMGKPMDLSQFPELPDFDGPVVYGLPVGHVEGPALTLPLGVRARVVAGASPEVIIEEGAVV